MSSPTVFEELRMYKELYKRASLKIESLEKRLSQEEYCNLRYRMWFTYHRNWVAHHNRLIKYNPEYGRSMLKGGKSPDNERLEAVRSSDREILDELGWIIHSCAIVIHYLY